MTTLGLRDNVWSVIVVAKASGLVTILPVNMPLELHAELVAFLERKLSRVPEKV